MDDTLILQNIEKLIKVYQSVERLDSSYPRPERLLPYQKDAVYCCIEQLLIETKQLSPISRQIISSLFPAETKKIQISRLGQPVLARTDELEDYTQLLEKTKDRLVVEYLLISQFISVENCRDATLIIDGYSNDLQCKSMKEAIDLVNNDAFKRRNEVEKVIEENRLVAIQQLLKLDSAHELGLKLILEARRAISSTHHSFQALIYSGVIQDYLSREIMLAEQSKQPFWECALKFDSIRSGFFSVLFLIVFGIAALILLSITLIFGSVGFKLYDISLKPLLTIPLNLGECFLIGLAGMLIGKLLRAKDKRIKVG